MQESQIHAGQVNLNTNLDTVYIDQISATTGGKPHHRTIEKRSSHFLTETRPDELGNHLPLTGVAASLQREHFQQRHERGLRGLEMGWAFASVPRHERASVCRTDARSID